MDRTAAIGKDTCIVNDDTRRALHDTTRDWAVTCSRKSLARAATADARLPLALRTVTGFVMGVVQAQLTRPVVGATDPDIERAQAPSPERHPN